VEEPTSKKSAQGPFTFHADAAGFGQASTRSRAPASWLELATPRFGLRQPKGLLILNNAHPAWFGCWFLLEVFEVELSGFR